MHGCIAHQVWAFMCDCAQFVRYSQMSAGIGGRGEKFAMRGGIW